MSSTRIILILLLCFAFAPAGARAESSINWDEVSERAKRALYKAQQLMNESAFGEAIEHLEGFAARHPEHNHFLIEFNIGTCYGFLNDQKKAIAHLEKAADLNAEYSPIWLNLGKMYYGAEQFDESGKALEKGVALSAKKEPDLLFMAMAAYYQSANYADSIRVGEELITTYQRQTFNIISLLANAYITIEDYDGAIAMLSRLLEANPNNEKVWKLLAQAYFKNQQYRKAAVSYESYGYLHGLDRKEIMVMGDLFTMVGIPIRAAHYYKNALSEGGDAREYEKMSVAYYSAYEFDKAIAAIDKAIEEKKTPERLLLKAQLYYLQSEFKKAQELYVAAAQQLSTDGHEWLMAGYCAMRSGEIDIAKDLLQKAVSFPQQRQEAMAMLKMLTPVEEIQHLMSSLGEAQNNTTK